MFSVSTLRESTPQGYFITGYDIGTATVELEEYSKCFTNHTHRTLLAIQLQCDGKTQTTRYTQTSQCM